MVWEYDKDRGQNSVFGIISAERSSGIPMSVTSTVRAGGGGSYHDTGNAVDFSDGTDTANESRLAQWIIDNYLTVTAELIHSGGKGYYIYKGAITPASTYSAVLKDHHNHVHWAITNSGLKAKGAPVAASGINAQAVDITSLDPTGITAGIKTLINFSQSLIKISQFLTDPHNWWRIAEFILGCGLLYFGIRGLNIAAANAVLQPIDKAAKSVKKAHKKASKAVKEDTEKKLPIEKPQSDTARRNAKINAVKRGADVEPLQPATTAIKDTLG